MQLGAEPPQAAAPAPAAGAGDPAAAAGAPAAPVNGASAPAGPAQGLDPPLAGDSRLRRAGVRFSWEDVMLAARPARRDAADAAFELGSALEAAALCKMRRAAHLCQDARGGTSLEAATRARAGS